MSLKTELTTDPLRRGYSTLTYKQILDSLYVKDRLSTNNVTLNTLEVYCLKEGIRSTLANKANDVLTGDVTGDMVINLCRDLIAAFESNNVTELDVNSLIFQMGLNIIVTAGVITNDQSAAITALGNLAISRAVELKLGSSLTEGHIKGAQS